MERSGESCRNNTWRRRIWTYREELESEKNKKQGNNQQNSIGLFIDIPDRVFEEYSDAKQ